MGRRSRVVTDNVEKMEADIVLVGMIRVIHERSFLDCGTQRATIVVLSVVNDLSCDYDGVI